ncbi:Manganese-binding protein [Roseomonas mucosa]|uniref:Manganese-binding protein n=1 Tax=Roseomonas mucosa TaxID=207340 RepID=A0A4Y1MWQ5_9PROT|nr:Manganese-binding protein [Roseomonas mucosa]
MRRRSTLLLAPALLSLGNLLAPGSARAQAAAPSGAPRLDVVASFSILGDMVRQVGGDRVAIHTLVGPGGDSHTYQPRPSDAAAIRSTGLVVRNGLGFEPWLDRLIRSSATKARIATASQGVTPRKMVEEGHGHSHEATDPHAWQDLRNGQAYAGNIAEALAAADPEGADLYRRNAAAFRERLASLDAWVREQVATVPEARRIVVTSHDAFGYFGAAYGVRFEAPQGMSTESEPSAAQVAALIRQVRAKHVTAVFIENMTNPALLERLARDAGAKVQGELFSDSLSPPDGPAATYEAMFRHNVGLLVPAMRGA